MQSASACSSNGDNLVSSPPLPLNSEGGNQNTSDTVLRSRPTHPDQLGEATPHVATSQSWLQSSKRLRTYQERDTGHSRCVTARLGNDGMYSSTSRAASSAHDVRPPEHAIPDPLHQPKRHNKVTTRVSNFHVQAVDAVRSIREARACPY